jgi:hypothetical protein
MILASRLVVALAVAGLFCAPLHADVIPSRRAAESAGGASRAVESRLIGLGADAEGARAEVDRLTDAETAYFAAAPERIQAVGQEIWAGQSNNLWWEWIGGIALLTVVVYVIYVFAINND